MYKKILTTVAAAFSLMVAVAAISEQTISSKVDNVTVFFKGAQVYRSANISLTRGVNKLIFEGVSPRVNTKSIQLSGIGNYTIMDVKHASRYPEANPASENDPLVIRINRKIALTKDSIQQTGDNIQDVDFELEVFNKEKSLLLNSGVMQQQDTLPELQATLEYLRSQLLDIHLHLLRLTRERRGNSHALAAQQRRLTALENHRNSLMKGHQVIQGPVHYIEVSVVAEQAIKGRVKLNYMVNNAGWTPSYDLAAKNTNEPIELTYKAAIHQSTEVDWEDVNITLSALDPHRNTRKPVLSRWGLQYVTRYPMAMAEKKQFKSTAERAAAPSMVMDYELEAELTFAEEQLYGTAQANGNVAMESYNFQVQSQSFSNVEYQVRLPYTIKSDGSDHHVVVKKEVVNAEFVHYAVPKISQEAFLLARLSEWADLNLMEATANLYFDGTYVGETQINPNIMTDTLELSLGTDKDVYVERKNMKSGSKTRVIGVNKKVEANYLFTVRNNKNSKIHLIIEDQIPVALNEEITVDLLEAGKGDLDEVDGIMRWEMNLKSGDSKTFEMGYSVEWKKEKDLNLPAL